MKSRTTTTSQRGKKGTVGAPAKPVSYPKGAFTIEQLVTRNLERQCELSVRNKVTAAVKKGAIVRLLDKHQPKGAVGRPMRVFVLKGNFNADTMTKYGQKPHNKTNKNRTVKVSGIPATAQTIPLTINKDTTETAEVPASPTPAAPAVEAPVQENTPQTEPVVA